MKTLIIRSLSVLPKHLSKRAANQFSKLFKAIGMDNTKVLCTWQYEKGKNIQFYINSNFTVAHYSYLYGQEGTLLRNSLKLLKNKKDIVIFDVGCNFGFLSMVWAKMLQPEVKVYSFEAHPGTCASVKQSIKDNQLEGSMIASNFAVGREDGELEMYLRHGSVNKRSSSKEEKDIVKVPMTAIDSFVKNNKISKIDFIKIDVDGMEYEILTGAAETLKRFKPDMVIETNNDVRIMELVRGLGYHLYHLNFKKVTGDEIPENVICLSKEYVQ